MEIPKELRYTDDHEWARREDDGTITVGITAYATEALGDVVYVDLLVEVGGQVSSGEEFGAVESVKTVSDLYSPVSGEVVAVNEELDGNWESVNASPYAEGWIIRIKPSDKAFESLMDATSYEKLLNA